MNRSRLSAVAAGATAAESAEARPAAGRPAASTWLVPHDGTYSHLVDTSLGGSQQVAASAFNHGTTWFSAEYAGAGRATENPIPGGYTGVAVLKFEAYRNGSTGLLDAISAGLPAWVQAVQYDCESWGETPASEQGAWLYNSHARASYAQLFCRTAHERGLRVVLSPGNDLCNNEANDAYTRCAPQYPVNSGEACQHAYVRYELASAARWLSPGDMYEYQAQVLELDTVAYRSITSQVARQVRAVSTGVTFLAGIGRTGAAWDHATSGQLAAAARSVAGVVAGFWPNVDADATRVRAMISFLQDLGY